MKILQIISILIALSSCTSVSVKDVQPITLDNSSGCDTAGATFSGTILPLITAQCNECHGPTNPNSGIPLSNYTQISRQSKNGTLYNVLITGEMPPNGPLPSCDILKIKKWIDEGSLNN